MTKKSAVGNSYSRHEGSAYRDHRRGARTIVRGKSSPLRLPPFIGIILWVCALESFSQSSTHAHFHVSLGFKLDVTPLFMAFECSLWLESSSVCSAVALRLASTRACRRAEEERPENARRSANPLAVCARQSRRFHQRNLLQFLLPHRHTVMPSAFPPGSSPSSVTAST